MLLLGVFFFLLFHRLISIYVENKYWSRIIVSLILVLLFKTDWGIHFYGLEYEDAYVFNFVARQFANNIFSHSFLADGILVGSIDNPVSIGTYGGHFITYSVFLSYFYQLIGFEPHYICYINTLLEFFSILILSIFPIKNIKTNSWFLLPLIYCIAPIMNVFSNTGFSETFSSFICLSFLFIFIRYCINKNLLNFFSLIIALFLSFLCKRENICLLIIPIGYIIWYFFKNRKVENRIDIAVLISSFSVFIIYLAFVQNIFNIEQIESKDIHSATFGIQYFKRLFPIFLQSLFSFNHFSISVYLLILSAIFALKQKETLNLLFILLFLIYLSLYSFHYRGYFFIKYDELSIFDSFRYLNNFYYLVPIIAYPILCYLIIKYNKWIVYSLGIITLFLSFVFTFNFRQNFSEEEQENRFHSVKTVCDLLENVENAILITESILLYQLISDNKFEVCDIRQSNNNSQYLANKNVFVLVDNESISYLKERYGIELSLDLKNPILKGNSFGLYKTNIHNSDL
jgi:hypothetical protein